LPPHNLQRDQSNLAFAAADGNLVPRLVTWAGRVFSGGFGVKSRAFFGSLAGMALALAAAACAPAETAGPVSDQQNKQALIAAAAQTELGRRIGTGPQALVAGSYLDADRLRRFYARRAFQPVWTTRQAEANALTDVVMRAGDHGLAPDLFHANLLRRAQSLPPIERDLVQSDAFMSYADALARGVVPVERRRDDEILNPGPVDVAAAFDATLQSPDPATALESLAPQTPTYRALREALSDLRAGKPVAGKAVNNADLSTRWRAVEVNLERERWLPRKLPADRIVVNAASQQLVMYRQDQPVFTTRVIVGMDERPNQSPEFQVAIDAIWFNPPWNIPRDIAEKEYLPLIEKDPDYLAKHNLVMLPDGILQQRAGPYAGLGYLMFDMNNKFDVYLHDTPGRELFKRDNRRISHGCIRVENPRELAALVMQQSPEEIDQTIATGDTSRIKVPKPVPVFVTYETAYADLDGKVQFRPDIYGRDADIWQSIAAPLGRY
jgi:murein L,D-transpeptidase YcbB/YkuD